MRRRLPRFLIPWLFLGPAALAMDPALHTPAPPYPYEARAHHALGKGECRVVFDASGHVASASMVASTGSPLLDENTAGFARQHWSGSPNTQVVVPINYQLFSKVTARVRVVCGADGHVKNATIVGSTGSPVLDQMALDAARKKVSRYPDVAAFVPVTFRLKEPEPRAIVSNPPR